MLVAMSSISFKIEKRMSGTLGRAGVITTPHGAIETPAFIPVGTKAAVKALTPEQVAGIGAQAVLANTYHLYLQPGEKIVEKAGGVGKFMHWDSPTFTDSGGFQVFSLGAGFGLKLSKLGEFGRPDQRSGLGKGISKFVGEAAPEVGTTAPAVFDEDLATSHGKLARVDEEGVTFTSHIDGSLHRFIPERSIEIQHALGADIMFAFDECTSPSASKDYQREAMERTHVWAKRSVSAHRQNIEANARQGLFGIVQGGRFEDLRKESARELAGMDFDGYGIGGSFSKKDLDDALVWVNEILPQEKPRHLLGIGEPEDLFIGVENGIDTFDCVAPTRMGRTGSLYTENGKINITATIYRSDFSKPDVSCECYTCANYAKAYLSHLFRAKEMLGATLASIHNLYFIVNLVKRIRVSILEENFGKLKIDFLEKYRR